MGRAIDQDNKLADHDRRIEILEGVVEELSRALINTKQTKNVDLHDALEQHEKEIRESLEKELYIDSLNKLIDNTNDRNLTKLLKIHLNL